MVEGDVRPVLRVWVNVVETFILLAEGLDVKTRNKRASTLEALGEASVEHARVAACGIEEGEVATKVMQEPARLNVGVGGEGMEAVAGLEKGAGGIDVDEDVEQDLVGEAMEGRGVCHFGEGIGSNGNKKARKGIIYGRELSNYRIIA